MLKMRRKKKARKKIVLREHEAVIRRALVLLDGIIVAFSFFAAYFVRQYFPSIYKLDIFPSIQVFQAPLASLSDYLVVLFFVVPLWVSMLFINDLYLPMRTRKFYEILWGIIKSSFISVFIFGAIVFLFRLDYVSRLFFVFFVIIVSGLLLLEKSLIFSAAHYARRRGYDYRRLLIVGTGKRAAKFIKMIKQHPEWGFQIFGAVEDEPGRGIDQVDDVGVIGDIDNLSPLLHRHAIDEVIFVIPRLRLHHMTNAIASCEIEGVKATIAVDLFDMKIARARQTELNDVPLLTFDPVVAKEGQLFIKRIIDIAISGVMIILLAPLLLITTLLIKFTSPGPVLFTQRRVGLNGRKFTLYKFRTMYKGAEKKLSKLEQLNEMGGPVFKIKKDPRITPFGKILRKFSIDELPQLFNVFVGQMSLVGPRPPIPKEVVQYEPWQRRRLSMRPGLSCLWQVSGRNKIDFDEWMKLDLRYLDNWSIWLDFKIMVKTIPVVMFGIGAS